MKTRILTMLAAAFCMLGLSSCFKQEVVLTVNPDGSGLIEESVEVSENPMFGAPQGEKADPLKKLLDKDQYIEYAANYGEGVTFEKVEEIKAAAGSKAAKITFKVADVNKLTWDVSQSASSKAISAGITPQTKGDLMEIKYADGVLTLKNPNDDMNFGDEGENQISEIENMPDAQFNMMKGLMGDVATAFRVKVNGTISETNATYNDNGTVTLMEMNMGQIMDSKDNMIKMAKLAQEKDKEVVKKKVKDVKGIKVETSELVTIKFK